MKEKTFVDDIDESIYDFRYDEDENDMLDRGITPQIINEIADEKHDPDWMRAFRLHSLELYYKQKMPVWGPSIEGLDMDQIVTYIRPKARMRNDWEDVPDDIKNTFEKLGIPQAEREHFMKLVPPTDHKFAALHGAVWSGGSFVYVPKGVHVDIPLQSYFRLNAEGAGQFEHTLIIVEDDAYLHFIEGCSAPKYYAASLHAGCVELFVGKRATLRYSTIENWSKNMYNLNTKRALVDEGGKIEWVSGSFGSHVSYLYPTSVLNGEGARSEFTGITFSGAGQDLDTGAKVIHNAPNTSSYMNTRSISKGGGGNTFRSEVRVTPKATGSKSSVSCASLMLDSESRSDTIPAMDIRTKDADIGHEAKIGRISDDAVFYLMSRGMSEEEAKALIVSGFADNVGKELPMEYAIEMNNLIRLEMTGSIG